MLLVPEDVLSDDVLAEVNAFFKNLPVLQRALWRWIFPEPDGVLGYPRQRVRRELEEGADFERANEIMASSAEDEAILAPHNRNSLVFKVGQTAAEEWAANALRTQNQVLDKLPPLTGESSMFTSLSVWLRMIQAAHAQTVLRKPSGMEAVRAWAPASSVSQRSALSTILLSLTDHMTAARGGVTTTKIAYGPKSTTIRQTQLDLIALNVQSTLGRPSTAPIVAAVQHKLEAKIREEKAKMIRSATELKRLKLPPTERGPTDKAVRRDQASSIPMFNGSSGKLQTSTQAQMGAVRAGMKSEKLGASDAAISKATMFFRTVGEPAWHGDAHYARFYPSACKGVQEIPHFDKIESFYRKLQEASA